jgi:hypothetical protein
MARLVHVTSRWHGELSFPEFLKHRKQNLMRLKRNLNWLSLPEIQSNSNPHVCHSNSTRDWSQIGPPGTVWLATAPVILQLDYPIFLDLAESARFFVNNKLLRSMCDALAPTYSKLTTFGLTNANASKPRWDDVDGDHEDPLGAFLISALSRCLGSLGSSYGVILRNAHRYDDLSEMFVHRLLREASATGLKVAFDGTPRCALERRYGSIVRTLQTISSGDRGRDFEFDPDDPMVRFLSVSNQGLPTELLRALCPKNVTDFLPACAGPAGERWAFLPRQAYLKIRSGISKTLRKGLHNEIFKTWSPNGWGYLRRAVHAIDSQNSSNVLNQHTSYVHGIRDIGRNFARRQFIALCSSIGGPFRNDGSSRQALVGAARLTSMVFPDRTSAVRYYERAMLDAQPALAANLIYEVANLFARRRSAENLKQATYWCDRGSAALSSIEDPKDRLYAEIRFHNVKALIAYHAGKNDEALALEKQAYARALRASKEYPLIAEWAKTVIRANMAKLLERRFQNVAAAMALLEQNLSAEEPAIAGHAQIELARLNIERGNYLKVVELLSYSYEGHWSATLNEQQELLGQLMLSIGLGVLGEQKRLRRQLGRVAYLHRVVGKPEREN